MAAGQSIPGIDYTVQLGGVAKDYPLPVYTDGQMVQQTTDLLGMSRILSYTARASGSATVPYANATYAVGTCVGTGNALIPLTNCKKSNNDSFTIEQFTVIDPTNIGPDLIVYFSFFDGFLGASTVVDQAAPSLATIDKGNIGGRIAITAADYSQFGTQKVAVISPFASILSTASGTYCKFFVMANKTGGWLTSGTGSLTFLSVVRL